MSNNLFEINAKQEARIANQIYGMFVDASNKEDIERAFDAVRLYETFKDIGLFKSRQYDIFKKLVKATELEPEDREYETNYLLNNDDLIVELMNAINKLEI